MARIRVVLDVDNAALYATITSGVPSLPVNVQFQAGEMVDEETASELIVGEDLVLLARLIPPSPPS